MKPRLLFKAIRQSQRDRRIHALRHRPRLLMPVIRFVDTNLPHTLSIENCEWFHGIQNMVVPAGAAPRTRNIVRIDVTDPDKPACFSMKGYRGYVPHLPAGYRVEWNGKVWVNPARLDIALDGEEVWCPVSWDRFDWVKQ